MDTKKIQKERKIFFLENIFRKLFFLIKYSLRANFFFDKPQSHKILIFDCESTQFIEAALHKFKYSVLSTRAHKIKKIYLTKKILKFIVINLFKRSFKQNYLISLIEEIEPKIVITHIDNSKDFHIMSKYFYKRIKFIAIQKANRETKWALPSECKKIFIPEYLCFSDYDKYIYKLKKTNVKNFHVIGSLVASLANKYVKDKKIKINSQQYDICLVGEAQPYRKWGDANHLEKLGFTVGTIAEYAHKFCKKYNLKLIFPSEYNKDDLKGYQKAKFFYKGYLKNYNFNYTLKKNKYSSYLDVMRSKVVIGATSTLLRESLAFNKKVLCCNYTGNTNAIHELPIKGFILRKSGYILFEKKLLKILSLSKKNYMKQVRKNYFMLPKNKAINYTQSLVKSYLK